MNYKSLYLILYAIVSFALYTNCDKINPSRNIHKGKLLYESSMLDSESVKGWKMEGPGEVTFADGWMNMYSPNEKMHHVYWCPRTLPERFVAEWEAQNLHPEAGLCIVFFAAKGENGEDIFDPKLPTRNGDFEQYTKGRIVSYHISYYANAPHNPDRSHAHLRKNNMFTLVQKGTQGIATKSRNVHKICLVKDGPHITMYVDGRKIIDWTDDGKKYGPIHTDGRIGFRQMKWTQFRYRNFKVWALNPTKDKRNVEGVLTEEKKISSFPGAEGFGAYSKGGRAGKMIFVTNLKDYDPSKEEPIPGSFRAACAAKDPRIVIFRVSGTIKLKTALWIIDPYITIAGQTAPGDGICLRDESVIIGTPAEFANEKSTHDVIIRYMRFRVGPDGLQEQEDALVINNAHDVIIDHCSVSWGVDEVLSITAHPYPDPKTKTYNITVQWCIISEGLLNSEHHKGPHSMAFMCTYGPARISAHHNLLMHCNDRNPNVNRPFPYDEPKIMIDWVNNVVYNYGRFGGKAFKTPSRTHEKGTMNFVGNYYIMGPNSTKRASLLVGANGGDGAVYAKGNLGPIRTTLDMDEYACV